MQDGDIKMADMIEFNNNNKILSEEKIEKEDENNSKIISKIVNLKLKIFFKYIISIFKKRENILKVQFFFYLKSLQEKNDLHSYPYIPQKDINKILKSLLIFHKINTSLKNIFFIYKNSKFRRMLKYFEFWKRYISLCSSLETEINSKNSYDKKINDLNKKIKNMNKLKDNLKLDEKKISQSLQVKEEQRNTKQKNIKNLSNKYKQLQKEKDSNKAMKNNLLNIKNDKSNLNTNTTNSIRTKESEEKILELESNLRQIKEEKLNDDRKFKNFLKNVEDNLNNFESKALCILEQKRQKSVEIKKEDYEASLDNNKNMREESLNFNNK